MLLRFPWVPIRQVSHEGIVHTNYLLTNLMVNIRFPCRPYIKQGNEVKIVLPFFGSSAGKLLFSTFLKASSAGILMHWVKIFGLCSGALILSSATWGGNESSSKFPPFWRPHFCSRSWHCANDVLEPHFNELSKKLNLFFFSSAFYIECSFLVMQMSVYTVWLMCELPLCAV